MFGSYHAVLMFMLAYHPICHSAPHLDYSKGTWVQVDQRHWAFEYGGKTWAVCECDSARVK